MISWHVSLVHIQPFYHLFFPLFLLLILFELTESFIQKLILLHNDLTIYGLDISVAIHSQLKVEFQVLNIGIWIMHMATVRWLNRINWIFMAKRLPNTMLFSIEFSLISCVWLVGDVLTYILSNMISFWWYISKRLIASAQILLIITIISQ